MSSISPTKLAACARQSPWAVRVCFGAALLAIVESCRNPFEPKPTGFTDPRVEPVEAGSIPLARPPEFLATGNAARPIEATSPYSGLSPAERHRELAHCLRTETGCDEQTSRSVLAAAADDRERATLEALVTIRRAVAALLHIVTDRDPNRVREESAECYRLSVEVRHRLVAELGRVEDANTKLWRLAHDPQAITAIPGLAWLRQAESQVRWCTDCAPKHVGQCSGAEDSLHRARAAMDAAGW